jgi:hypothetical protein
VSLGWNQGRTIQHHKFSLLKTNLYLIKTKTVFLWQRIFHDSFIFYTLVKVTMISKFLSYADCSSTMPKEGSNTENKMYALIIKSATNSESTFNHLSMISKLLSNADCSFTMLKEGSNTQKTKCMPWLSKVQPILRVPSIFSRIYSLYTQYRLALVVRGFATTTFISIEIIRWNWKIQCCTCLITRNRQKTLCLIRSFLLETRFLSRISLPTRRIDVTGKKKNKKIDQATHNS